MDINKFYGLSLEDKLKVCKFCYSRGIELVDDAIFDDIYKKVPDSSPVKYINWEEVQFNEVSDLLDLIEVELPIECTNMDKEEVDIVQNYSHLQNLWGKNKSIEMIDSLDSAKNYYAKQIDEIYQHSAYKDDPIKILHLLKYDGWNLTLYYVPGKLEPVLIHTRGRGNNCIYCTHLLAKYSPQVQTQVPIRVVVELCLDSRALDILRDVYGYTGREFKNTRNSISSIVHGTVDVEYIKQYLYMYAFAIETENGPIYGSLYENLTLLSQLGFSVPLCCYGSSVNDFDVMIEYMTEQYKALEPYVKCDGVVQEANHYSIAKECTSLSTVGTFQTGLIAIKSGYWSKKVYVGEVVDIEVPTARVNRSVVAIIKPVIVSSGSEVKRVPLINMRRASAYGKYVDIGDRILFTYHSEQNVHFEGFENSVL